MVWTVIVFIYQWARTVVYASSLPGIIVKCTAILGGLFAFFAITDQVSLHLRGELGKFISVSALVVVALVALGATLVRFQRLELGKDVERDQHEYRYSVTNHGFMETRIAVRVEEIVDQNGPVKELSSRLPVPLEWWNCPETGNPVLARGSVHKIRLIFQPGRTDGDRKFVSFTAGWSTHGGTSLLFKLYTETRNKYWFRVSFGGQHLCRWFSVCAIGPQNDGLEIKLENPPVPPRKE